MSMNAVELAANLLKEGKLVAIPTETVYGLAADASQMDAIAKIFIAKGRPTNHPLIVHLADISQIWDWGKDLSQDTIQDIQLLAHHFWPGPLTLIIKKANWVPDIITGQQDTVAIRVPNHPLTLALLNKMPNGVVAPSANRFGRISPTEPIHVQKELGNKVAYILDGGSCQVGIESTIVSLASEQPLVLRPGMISPEQLSAILNKNVLTTHKAETTIRAPGVLDSHYAPKTPFYRILTSNTERLITIAPLIKKILAHYSNYKKIALISHGEYSTSELTYCALSDNPDYFSQKIYSTLHTLDEAGYDLILCYLEESIIQQQPHWLSILDRLQKATLDNILITG